VIVLSDHGWEDRQWGHKRKPDGFAILAGGPALAARPRGKLSVYDVAPTVLALLGIPVPEDMDGRVAVEFFEPSFWRKHPVRRVSSYERPVSYGEDSGPKVTDDKVLEQLRALGYVGQ